MIQHSNIKETEVLLRYYLLERTDIDVLALLGLKYQANSIGLL
jgi:hypothetical protein